MGMHGVQGCCLIMSILFLKITPPLLSLTLENLFKFFLAANRTQGRTGIWVLQSPSFSFGQQRSTFDCRIKTHELVEASSHILTRDIAISSVVVSQQLTNKFSLVADNFGRVKHAFKSASDFMKCGATDVCQLMVFDCWLKQVRVNLRMPLVIFLTL